MKKTGNRYFILFALLAMVSLPSEGRCIDYDTISYGEKLVLPAKHQEFTSVQEAVSQPEVTESDETEITDTQPAEPIVMPTLPDGYVTYSNGELELEFASGTLSSDKLESLWAKITFTDGFHTGGTEVRQLDLSQLNPDGRSIKMKFDPEYHGKPINIEFYGIDKNGLQTGLTNPVRVSVVNNPSSLDAMPGISDSSVTVENGKATVTFDSGTLAADQLSSIGAKVFYFDQASGKQVVDWLLYNADPASVLAADGKSLTVQLDPKFDGRDIHVEFQGTDKQGNNLGFTDAVEIKCGYYWGPIGNMNISGAENQLYYTDQRASHQRVRTVSVADNKLTADVQYQNMVDPSNPHYENVYRETTTMDLKTGEVTLTDGSKLTPADGDKYVAAVNDILSVERYQERGADAAQLAALTPVRDYLTGIKEKSGGSKYYFGAGLDPMNIGTGESGARSVKVNVNNDILLVSDIDTYTSYTLDLLSGDMIASFMSSGINPSTPDEPAYTAYVQGMLAMVDDASKNTPDVAERAKLQGVTDFLNKTIAPSVTMPALPAAAGTNRNGKVTLDFTSGTLLPGQLKEFRAQVSYNGRTEDWNLGTGAISAEGNSITMRFDRNFAGKTVSVQFYGIDLTGKKTDLSNSVDITVKERWRRPHHR